MSILKERIEYLKSSKKLANTFLEVYKEAQNNSGYKSWEKDVIFFNVKKLKEIILEINKLLKQKSLDEYVKANEAKNRIINGKKKLSDFPDDVLTEQLKGFGLPFKIVRYSPSYSLLFDLNWIKDGTVQEHMQIALGNIKIETISSMHYDYRMEKVSECVQSYILTHSRYSICYQVLDSAVVLSRAKNYLASNILILTAIESLVRLLVEFILLFQFPELAKDEIKNLAFKKFNSLETLIKKCEFKEDYPVTLPDALLLRNFVDDQSLDKCKLTYDKHFKEASKYKGLIKKFMDKIESLKLDKIEYDEFLLFLKDHEKELNKVEEDAIIEDIHSKKYLISIRVKLYFLVRRLKDLRNEIIHGKFDVFSTKHYNYISLAALFEVIELLKEYDNIYRKNDTILLN